jgi:hypothetical protein
MTKDNVQDIPDLIAGALGVSRGTAYDMMREALKEATPVQEPVAWIWKYANGEEEVVFVPPRHVDATHVDAPSTITPLYTTPPAAQRQWVGLTDEAIWSEYQTLWPFHPAEEPRMAKDIAKFARAIEEKLREKNT